MQTEFNITIENDGISLEIDGIPWISRPLTSVELTVIQQAAKYDRMEIYEFDKGQAALLSLLSLELCKIIKYGMDENSRLG